MKVDQKLLEQIIFEVIERFTAKPQLLLIYDGKLSQENIKMLVLELQNDWQVELYDLSTDTTMQLLQKPLECQHFAFLNVNQDLLVRGALGLTDTPASQLLAKALLEGCPVLLEPTKELQWLLHKQDVLMMRGRAIEYYTHLLTHKNTLVKFGAWFGRIASWRASELRYDRKLLTENDIKSLDTSKIAEIRVQASTIITNLARDIARQKGIQIRVD